MTIEFCTSNPKKFKQKDKARKIFEQEKSWDLLVGRRKHITSP